MDQFVVLCSLFGLVIASPINIDPGFSVDPKELQLNEMSQNIKKISGAVMGIAELVVEIKSDLQTYKKEVKDNRQRRNENELIKQDDRIRKNYDLAEQIEKLFNNKSESNSQVVDKTKEELKKTLESNFLRVLSAMMNSGPMQTPEMKADILELMQLVVNGRMDFGPVVEKLPFLLRESETNQFIYLLKILKDEEDSKRKLRQDGDGEDENETETETETVTQAQAIVVQQPQRLVQQPQIQQFVQNPQQVVQNPQLQQFVQQPQQVVQATTKIPMKSGLEKVIEAVNNLDVNQITDFLIQIPEIFEGVQTLVDF